MSDAFYVYLHIDPETREVVYVGKGIGGRAWDVTRARGGHRAHQEWMQSLMSRGFIPTDWVFITARNLPEDMAFAVEKAYLHKNGVLRFNRQSGEQQHQAKLTNEQVVSIYTELQDKQSKVKSIAERYKVSRAAIYMIKSGKQWKAVTAGLRNENL